jgi:glycosyltransferase involved in cell wall biosynthesis
VVTPDGGPKFIVRDGETGFVTEDDRFAGAVAKLVRDRTRLKAMGLKARDYALGCSWDAVFDRVYAGYETVLARVDEGAEREPRRVDWCR